MSTEISVTFRRVSRWNCRDGTVRMLASLFGVWMTSWLVMPRPSPTVVRVYCSSCSNRPPSTTQKQGQCESGFQLIDHCVSVHYVHVPFIHYISMNISTNYWRLYNLIDWLLFNTISAVFQSFLKEIHCILTLRVTLHCALFSSCTFPLLLSIIYVTCVCPFRPCFGN